MKTVFIVEGWSDADQIEKALHEYDFGIVVTNGTKINNRLKEQINSHLEEGSSLYILSDPDLAGEQLSNMITHFYPDFERIEVNPNKCRYMRGGGKFKYGIEYCSYRYLVEVLSPYLHEAREGAI